MDKFEDANIWLSKFTDQRLRWEFLTVRLIMSIKRFMYGYNTNLIQICHYRSSDPTKNEIIFSTEESWISILPPYKQKCPQNNLYKHKQRQSHDKRLNGDRGINPCVRLYVRPMYRA